MNARITSHLTVFVLLAALLVLAACQPPAPAASLEPTRPAQAEPTAAQPAPVETATPEPPAPTQPPAVEAAPGVFLDYTAAAQQVTFEIVPAKPTTAEAPYWEAAPEYRLLTLQGYPVGEHLHKPQIFIYPAGELASANEHMGNTAADLQALLQSQQPGERLPYLPVYNAQQVLHAQVQFIDFKNGRGVRYLTQYDQAPLPINNNELVYTFQGLTADGKYYIAAVFPVTHPELPSGDLQDEQAKAMEDFAGYLAGAAAMLDQ